MFAKTFKGLDRSTGPLEGGHEGHRSGVALRTSSIIILALLLLVTAAASWATHVVVRDQEGRLLSERTSEVRLVFAQSISAIPDSLTSLGEVLQATDGSRPAFTQAAETEVAAGPQLTYALVARTTAGQFVVVAEAGNGLRVGQVIAGSRSAALASALTKAGLVTTPVIGTGSDRMLGFAMGPPVAPAGTVLYRQSSLGPLKPPKAAGTAPFHEVQVAVYASPTLNPGQILVATTPILPVRGSVRYVAIPAGETNWLLAVAATQPLVGSVAAYAEWFVLVVGLAGSLLAAITIEADRRRRDAAAALYASEHQVAQTLQRSLLPVLPELAGLELATRYLAGGTGQEVGGDWFDVFEFGEGRVGIVIGDVVGHDLAAVTAMSQIRATLRAYAWEGAEPADVVDRLDRFVRTFSVAELVTVFYGILEAPSDVGTRVLRYTNAGHLPPLVRAPDGRVASLTAESSIVIGAPVLDPRTQSNQLFLPGSTLLLFTDGLVEEPGGSLEDSLNQLATVLGRADPAGSMESLCEEILSATPAAASHDDVAVLAVRVAQPESRQPSRPAGPIALSAWKD